MMWRRRRSDRDLWREIESHLEAEAGEQRASGMSASDAGLAARKAFGNASLVFEETRVVWGWGSLERLGQDLRYALRLLRKSWAFTATAVLSLAIGIGMNTAMFSLLDAVLLRGLPVPRPGDLVLLAERNGPRQGFALTWPAFQALQQSSALQGLAAFRNWRFRTAVHGETQLANGQLVSGNYYSVTGVKAALGRTLTPADDVPSGGWSVAVVSHEYWQRVLGGRPDVMGQNIELQGRPFTIVGVTERGFAGMEPGRAIDVTVPLTAQPVVMPGTPLLRTPNARWLRLVGRRKPGVSMAQAQANLRVFWSRLQSLTARRPGTPEPVLELVPGGQGLYDLRREFEMPLRILMAAVALVLLIACANLASLLLARATTRRQEIVLRLSLGATRGRPLRQLLTESTLLALIGGACGLLLAYWGAPLLVTLMSRGRSPIVLDLSLDARTLAFTTAASLATGILFGIMPALRTTGLASMSGARLISGGRSRWNAALIVAQVSLCLVVLACAGLLAGSLRNLRQVDAGFRPGRILLMSIRPGLSGYEGPRAGRLYADLQQRFSALPGVTAVTMSMDTPLGGLSYTTNATLGAGVSDGMQVSVNSVGPRFFETLGVRLLNGRDVDARDDERAQPVAVIGESVAHTLFPGRSPLGERLRIGDASMEVVGVARDTRYQSLRDPAQPMVYRPYLQMPGTWEELFFAIRTAGDPERIAASVRRELQDAAPSVPVFTLSTMDERVDANLVRERMTSSLAVWFGGFALLLAAVGLYGRLAYAVVERTREIGIRLALGAARRAVIWAIVRQVALLVAGGVAIGLPLSIVSGNAIRALLFGVPPSDPSTLSTVVLVIAVAAILAGVIPAVRTARVDPMEALRHE